MITELQQPIGNVPRIVCIGCQASISAAEAMRSPPICGDCRSFFTEEFGYTWCVHCEFGVRLDAYGVNHINDRGGHVGKCTNLGQATIKPIL